MCEKRKLYCLLVGSNIKLRYKILNFILSQKTA